MLHDYVTKHGHVVKEACTSEPCVWNKGKKREKDPKALHEATYKSKTSSKRKKLYHWDPRPASYRKANKTQLNNFVRDLQSYSANSGKDMSMWETLLHIEYEDFEVAGEEKKTIEALVVQFEQGLKQEVLQINKGNEGSVPIPDTEAQNESAKWFTSRWPRITASGCKEAFLLGQKLYKEAIDKHRLYKWLNSKLWNPQSVVTLDMLYGIQEEPAARAAYTKWSGLEVTTTGLWVNSKHPYLGASPDGLVAPGNGIIEIKCLKVLRSRTVDELIAECAANSSDILKNQCFSIRFGKLCLKRSHPYYFQVQMLLLVTEVDFCDFVLHSPKGPPAIERILPDVEFQKDIVRNTKML